MGPAQDALSVDGALTRLHRARGARPTEQDVAAALAQHGVSLGPGGARRVLEASEDEFRLAARDAAHVQALDGVRARLGLEAAPFLRVEALPSDVHDVGTLVDVAGILCPEGI